ncbi:MAG: hypothetical protein H6Q90_2350 [Deltaproteobacteria bacterium]|nr:hypothetical protein [Deltaproteobacteria bacterium]
MDAALIVLVIVVVLVAIDAIGRLDERRERRAQASRRADDPARSTQKIVVDLTGRDLD